MPRLERLFTPVTAGTDQGGSSYHSERALGFIGLDKQYEIIVLQIRCDPRSRIFIELESLADASSQQIVQGTADPDAPALKALLNRGGLRGDAPTVTTSR